MVLNLSAIIIRERVFLSKAPSVLNMTFSVVGIASHIRFSIQAGFVPNEPFGLKFFSDVG